MSVRSERFYGRMESLDVLDAALCEKARVLSDRGSGVRRLLDTLDARPGAVHDAERERDAVNGAMVLLWAIVLTAGGCGYLVPTLRLICQNGCDSAASVEAIRRCRHCSRSAARRLYQLHRHLLLEMFVLTKDDGAILDLTHPAFRFGVTEI